MYEEGSSEHLGLVLRRFVSGFLRQGRWANFAYKAKQRSAVVHHRVGKLMSKRHPGPTYTQSCLIADAALDANCDHAFGELGFSVRLPEFAIIDD